MAHRQVPRADEAAARGERDEAAAAHDLQVVQAVGLVQHTPPHLLARAQL